MKSFEKFLFFYCIVALTAIFISYGVFGPFPLNLIISLSLTPILFYFWIRLTSPESVGAEKWSVRFLTVILALILLGMLGSHFAKLESSSPYEKTLKAQLADSEAKNQVLSESLKKAQAKLDQKDKTVDPGVKGESIIDLISDTPAPSGDRITGKANITVINVYKEPISTSAKIGSLEPELNYPYLEKQNGWYKVVVTSTQTGWVSASDVIEVQ
jgi:hypothetical protein